MLTLRDCLDYCEVTDGLTEDALEALAAHQHLTLIGAAALADNLLRAPEEGAPALERLLTAAIAAAEARGDWRHALAGRRALRCLARRARPRAAA